jgi:hypothetical protein
MKKVNCMAKPIHFLCIAVPLVLTFASAHTSEMLAQNQHPILDKVAAKVIQKYETTPCAQLKEQKAAKTQPSAEEQKAIAFLKSDPQLRTIFINKIAAPIANKMFDCGMIP